MKTKLILAAGALAMLMTGCEPCKTASTEKTSLVTEKDKYSYALGAHFGNQARFQLVTRDSIDLDLDLFIQAFKERYNEDSVKFLMNDSIIMETLNKLSADRQAEKMKKDSIAAAKNKADGEAFLAQNKTAEGVVTTQSGLQYKIITEGTGATPTDEDKVKVHYTGTLLNGEKFDSSIDRGQPLEFPVTAVIPGWTEMLKLMKVGEKVIAWIPSDLAYGSRGNRAIPGNSLLKFEMELLEVIPPAKPAEEQKVDPKAAKNDQKKGKKPAAK